MALQTSQSHDRLLEEWLGSVSVTQTNSMTQCQTRLVTQYLAHHELESIVIISIVIIL